MRAHSRSAIVAFTAMLALALLMSPAAEARTASWSRTKIVAKKGRVAGYQTKSNGTRRAFVATRRGSVRASTWKMKNVKASSLSVRNRKGKIVASRRATVGRKGYTVRTRVGNKTTRLQKKANGTRRASAKTNKMTVSKSSWQLKNGVKASSTSIKNARGKVIASKRSTLGKYGFTIRTRVGDRRTVVKHKYDPKTNTASRLTIRRTPNHLRATYGAVSVKTSR